MAVVLGRDVFPDCILTDRMEDVQKLFVARACSQPFQDRTAKELITDWTLALQPLRKSRSGARGTP